MIRLTVEQLNALRDSIQAGGQVQCAILPLKATYAHRLIIAWAKGRSTGDEFYLSIWRDMDSLEKAREQEDRGERPPYDFMNDPQSLEYSHVYPPESAGTQGPEIPLTAQLDTAQFDAGVRQYLGNAGTVIR